jgi:hypothetical protein
MERGGRRIMEENQKALNYDTIQPTQKTEEPISFSRQERIFAYIMLALGYCFVRFVLWNVTGIFTTVFFAGTAFTCLYYLKKSGYRLNAYNKVIFGLLLLFSSVFSITDNGFIKFLDVVFLFIAGTYWVYSVCKENKATERFFFFNLVKAILVMPFASISKAPKAIVDSTNKSKSGNNIKLILLGLLVTIPLTFVVAGLLISADDGVKVILKTVFGSFFDSSTDIIMQLVLSVPVGFFLFGMLYSNANKVKINILNQEQCENTIKSIKIFPNLVMYSAVTPVCLLYVLFFLLQLRYFTSAFSGILPETYSYAEYARKGFFELTVIAVINLLILLAINFLSKQSGDTKTALLKGYSVLISIFTILLIATALSKMILYIGNYGLTQLRVYTSWFMILLGVLNVLILIKQFKDNFNFINYSVITFVLFFGILCFSNVDGNIAKYNIKMYQAGYLNELDVDALCSLSDDALVYILKEKLDTDGQLYWKLEQYKNNPEAAYNLSSFRVKKLLEEKY